MPATFASIRRCRPLLGTFVEIAVIGDRAADLEAAVEEAFAAIATVHGLMSVHEAASDVSRLNRAACAAEPAVHPWTFAVLAAALDFHGCSDGLFDVRTAPAPGPAGFELLSGYRVRLLDPELRIDLGGIAKGFAVDRAIDALRSRGISGGIVNAGGDVAAFGPDRTNVDVRDPGDPRRILCRVALRDNALATSGARFDPVRSLDLTGPEIRDPRTAEPPSAVIGATVRAPSCLVADALTKVVMIAGLGALAILRRFEAAALVVAASGAVHITEQGHDDVFLAA
jgi:thiamine biosynthesis lipoprotein